MLELLEGSGDPVRALAAGGALAAGLVLVELQPASDRLHDAHGVVEDHRGAGAHHRAGRGHVLVRHRNVEVLGREHRDRRPTGEPELHGATVAHATRVVEKLSHRDAQRGLVDAGAVDVT
jgi:hypothetical protein